ncbi:Nif3-like dinuclear metal center hexameric protein [Shewanella sp. NIFS-20-20]|uniref:Nif3-like dinuclear metal center hexameric protein n=1 Tax=Shewanella sp. NIFS-20-20 TaxID=2853806 RepID=UPI001C47DD71|nr:Nif3-like dinuclear metal center hexameric protein [Shewanella sp. NIFS-20-20]MBV7314588.1 Nif3-like dinuclear metal center hexameric protein [Shewanella sp. NIFS-20-20]
MNRQELQDYLHQFLSLDQYRDYAPNGLQIQGKSTIAKIVTGVTACQALIDAAIDQQADAILVHHGFFWKGEDPCIVGIKQQRIQALLSNDVNLMAYHLPLDGHRVVGNNATLGQRLGMSHMRPIEGVAQDLVWQGQLDIALSATEFAEQISQALGRAPLVLGNAQAMIKTIGWCTGGAQDYIDIAAQYGLDAFISGEASERTFHSANELGLVYFGAGHHATERYGIEALGQHLADKFGIDHVFIDVPNPV